MKSASKNLCNRITDKEFVSIGVVLVEIKFYFLSYSYSMSITASGSLGCSHGFPLIKR